MEPIRVWRFEDAPSEYLEYVGSHDDADWLAVVPVEMKDDYIPWIESSSFGCCSIVQFTHEDGREIYVGYHA